LFDVCVHDRIFRQDTNIAERTFHGMVHAGDIGQIPAASVDAFKRSLSGG